MFARTQKLAYVSETFKTCNYFLCPISIFIFGFITQFNCCSKDYVIPIGAVHCCTVYVTPVNSWCVSTSPSNLLGSRYPGPNSHQSTIKHHVLTPGWLKTTINYTTLRTYRVRNIKQTHVRGREYVVILLVLTYGTIIKIVENWLAELWTTDISVFKHSCIGLII